MTTSVDIYFLTWNGDIPFDLAQGAKELPGVFIRSITPSDVLKLPPSKRRLARFVATESLFSPEGQGGEKKEGEASDGLAIAKRAWESLLVTGTVKWLYDPLPRQGQLAGPSGVSAALILRDSAIVARIRERSSRGAY